MKKVLVTGAAGFIGSHIVDSYIKLGFYVHAVDVLSLEKAMNLKSASLHSSFSYHQLDITLTNALDFIFEEGLDLVCHYASVVGVEKYLSDTSDVIAVNVIGTQHVVSLVKKHKVDILFASTSEVYGKNPKVPWGEDDNRVLGSTSLERWSYSSSKATAEHLLMAALKEYDCQWLIVRYFNVYGPRQNANFVVSANLKNYIERKPLLCHNDGNQTRCYSYIEDVIEATLALINSGNSGIYNIGSEVETSVNELLDLINKIDDYQVGISKMDTSKALGDGFEDIPRRVPNIMKISESIDWKPNTSLTLGLKKTHQWILDNPWWQQAAS